MYTSLDAGSRGQLTGHDRIVLHQIAGLRENDATLLRIESDPIHDQYRANFRTLKTA